MATAQNVKAAKRLKLKPFELFIRSDFSMATNYNCISYTDDAGRDFLILKTLASNIKLVSLYNESKTCQTVKESGYVRILQAKRYTYFVLLLTKMPVLALPPRTGYWPAFGSDSNFAQIIALKNKA